jgi:hypothetical protein
MGLSLVLGPAHAGKVALLLDRYLEVLERDPWLVVPTRGDVERVERDLIRRRLALLAGRIGTFDDLFEHIAWGGDDRRPVASDPQRAMAVRRAIARVDLTSLGQSSRPSSIPSGSTATSLCSPGRIARSSVLSGFATGRASGAARSSCCGATSTRGTASPCSRTASRT